MSEPPLNSPADGPAFARLIGVKAARKLQARQSGPAVWFGLGMLGVIGWSVVGPTLVGTALGVWLDRHHAGGHNWTLALMMAGLALGCMNAWFWVERQGIAEAPSPGDNHA